MNLAKFGLRQHQWNEDHVYELVAPYRAIVREGPCDSRMVIVPDGIWVSWALLEWHHSDSDGSNVRYGIVAHGEGPSDALRECRHTYFGENGYVFSLPAATLTWCFEQLKEWFDFDG